MEIGLIGLGNIGLRLVPHLSEKYTILVYDIQSHKIKNAIREGGKRSTIDEIGKKCHIILLSLPGPSEVVGIIKGKKGLARKIKKGSTIVDLSTNYPDIIQDLGEYLSINGINLLECPVSGGIRAAENGTLSAFIGGNYRLYIELLPLLENFTKNRYYMGPLGSGSTTKLLNNRIALYCLYLSIETLIIGAKKGLDTKDLLEALKGSSAFNAQLSRLQDTVFQDNYEEGFPARLVLKDLKLIQDLENWANSSKNLSQAMIEDYQKIIEIGLYDSDQSVVVKILESRLNALISK